MTRFLSPTPRAASLLAAVALPLFAGCAGSPAVATSPSAGGATPLVAAVESDSPGMVTVTGQEVVVGASPAGNYLAAQHARHVSEFGRAADFIGRALRDAESGQPLVADVYRLLLAGGRVDEGIAMARKAVVQEPRSLFANVVLAVDAVARGDIAAADRHLDAVPRRGLGTFLPPLVGAWARVAEKDYAAAIKTIAPLGQFDGLEVVHHLQAGLILDLAGDLAGAGQRYEKANEAAKRPILRVVQALGSYYERSGQPQKARELYQRYREDSPDSHALDPAIERLARGGRPEPLVSGVREGLAEALFDVAGTVTQERTGEFALAFGHMALHLRPDLHLARMLVAGVLEAQSRWAQANEVYAAVPASSGLSWTARMRTALNLEALDEIERSVSLLRNLAADYPDRADPLITLGNILRTREKFVDAVVAYDQAFDRLGAESIHREPRYWSLYYSRGIALERSKQWARAEADFKAALALNPDQPYVLNYLGYSWVEQGVNIGEARRMIERAVELRPNDGYIVDSLGWAFFRLGDYNQAVLYLERAVELHPQDATINEHLGDAYWRVGRRNEARFQWNRALAFKPEPPRIPAIHDKLERGMPPPDPLSMPKRGQGI